MKTRHLIFTFIGIAFAIGSAFTTRLFTTETAWAEVLDSEDDLTWECKLVGSCSSGGVRQCKIAVPIEISPHSKIVKVSNENCITPLYSGSEITFGEIQFYDVRDWYH